jgi:hypothetical protein
MERQGDAIQWQRELKEGDDIFTEATKIKRKSMPKIGTAHKCNNCRQQILKPSETKQ